MINLKYSKNWNNKLGNKYYTTIRLRTPENMDLFDDGKPITAIVDNRKIHTGYITNVRVTTFGFLHDETINLDMGLSRYEARKELMKIYDLTESNIDDTGLIIITIKRDF